MSSTDEVRGALRILAAYGGRVPEMTIDFVELWASELRYADAEVLAAAAKAWVTNMSTFPTLKDFKDEVRIVAKRLDAARHPRLDVGLEDKTMTPPSERPARLAELRKAIAECDGPLFSGAGSKVI